MLSFRRMKQPLSSVLILMLAVLWPASGSLAAPSRFTEPANFQDDNNNDESMTSIARDTGEAENHPASPARPGPPASGEAAASSTGQKAGAEQAVKPLAGQGAGQDADKGGSETAAETVPRPATTIAESLSNSENGRINPRDTVEDPDELIEWVGRDRRIKRVKKATASIHLQSQKPANKLIITDDYHQSTTELLGTADVRYYGARPEESTWLYSGSKFLCELRHPIPGFGYAVMKQGVDEPLQFVVETDGITGGSGQARIQSRPPLWKRFTLVKDLGVVPIKAKDKILFSVPGEWVKRLLLELREGMQPTISFWDDDTGGDDVVLTVSSFNFQQHLPEFSTCLDNLLPYSFKDVRKRTLYFGYDKFNLSAEQTGRLTKLIEYVKLDETVQKVDITGYSDSVGFARYNQTLAQRRANAVKKFLLAQGLPADKLVVNARGEKGKKHTNRTEEGRRKNRRVEVTLIK